MLSITNEHPSSLLPLKISLQPELRKKRWSFGPRITINGHARAVKTLLRFFHREKYIQEQVVFEMPRIAKKKLLVLNIDEVHQVLHACLTIRDRLIIYLLVDTGIRKAEACALNWGDIDMENGLIRIVKGKGGKYRVLITIPGGP